ncbi:MAG TPA: RNA polymerase sigma factor [Thermomicrobiales bacterium]|nr:RNA polymerase sigma factor [Thermomicrobiales bacterium]
MDDSALVERAQSGDTSAYHCLMTLYQDLAFRAAYLITHDAAEAEDAAQEGFVKAFYALDRFRPGSPFRPWLLRIVTNEALNRRRAAGRRSGLIERVTRERLFPRWQPSPESAIVAEETRSTLLGELRVLSEMDRAVLSYRYLLDMPVDEIASILDCPQRTVRSRIARAMKRLEARLSQPDERAPAPDRSESSRA